MSKSIFSTCATLIAFGLAVSLQLESSAKSDVGSIVGKESSTAAAKSKPSQVEMVRFESTDKTISFDYPRDWVVSDDMEVPRIFQAYSTDRNANIIFSVQDLPTDMSLDAFVKITADDLANKKSKITPVQTSIDSLTINGAPARRLTYSTMVQRMDGGSLTQSLYITVKGHKAYMLCSTMKDPVQQVNQDIIDTVVSSIKVEETILRSIAVIKQDSDSAISNTQEFKDAKCGLTAQLPAQWKSDESGTPKVFSVGNGMGVSLILTSEALPEGADIPVDIYANKVVDLVLADPSRTSKKLEDHELTVNGTVMRKIVMQSDIPAKNLNGRPLIGRQLLYLFIKDGRSYGLIGSTVEAWYSLYEPVFTGVLKSMQFAAPSTSQPTSNSDTSSNSKENSSN